MTPVSMRHTYRAVADIPLTVRAGSAPAGSQEVG